MTRLRAVDLHGYKSFAARTSLQFDEPVTAIVGPNGSGKSNVMDALRWAIGAGSGRALRTRRAEDVVFSGGRDRAASGFAEVRVQFDNSDCWLELDAAEVEIVRRVHRDGQSEIRVNGRVARLRDVQDMFRNSGLGSGGFALMSQGLVDEMLRLRPHERRQAIEEVGGVRQHRHEMEESRRRRLRAQEHLERARLLRDELAPRLKSLERSARRARRLGELQQQIDEAQGRYFAAAVGESEHDLLVRHDAAQTAEAARSDAERRRDDATNALAAVEREAALARRTVDESAARLGAARSQLRTLEHQQELDQQQRSWLSREVSDLSTRLGREPGGSPDIDLQAAQDALARINRSLAETRNQRDQLERDQATASTRHQRALSDESIARSDAKRLVRRWKAAAAQAHLTVDAVTEAERCARRSQTACQSSEQEFERMHREFADARERSEEQQRKHAALSRRTDQIDAQIEALERRLTPTDTLRKIVHERLNDPARADAIFGELLDATLHDSLDEAIDSARLGLEADAGRVSAIEADRVNELIDSMIAVVEFVDRIETARQAAAEGRTAITHAGIVFRPDGVVQAGGSQPGARRLAEQLSELRAERDQIHAELDALNEQHESRKPPSELEAGLAAARAKLDEHRATASEAAARLESANRRRSAAMAERRAARTDAAQLRSRLEEARRQLQQTARALQDARSRPPINVSALEHERDRLAAELAEARAQNAAHERTRSDRARLSSLRRELEVVETNIREREPELERAAATAAESNKLETAREHLDLLNDRRTQAATELERLQQVRLNAERQAIEASAALRESESARARLAAEAAAEGINLGALHHATQPAFELNGAAHHAGNGSTNGSGNGSGNGASPAGSRTPTAVAIAAPSVAELHTAVIEARAKLQRLGPVDPGAAHEFEAEQARWQGIETQIADLEDTETSLRQAEHDLEQLIESRFREACRQVDEAFQRYFQLMFRGGKAQLVLTEEPIGSDDDAETTEQPRRVGVDIKAQPPGKRVSALGLLSGGERALTAIALLFALLEVRPAPFCILDEVDAALDEANVERFVNALQERASKTQFVLITHNRRTIEQAHSIYGVTMGAAGVSRLLSVRVDDLPHRDR